MESEINKLNLKLQSQNIPQLNKKKIYILFVFNIFIVLLFPLINKVQNQYLLYELRDIQTKLYNNKTNNQIYEIFNENIFIFDKLNLLKIITNNNPLIYKGYENCLISDPDNQQCIYHLIKSKKVVGKKRILLGEKGDGSYVILDDFENIKIAYSFGISNMIQFDNELAKRGIDVYMFDHTINSLPFNHSKFHWNKIGLAGLNESSNQLKTLEQLIINNGHINEFNMILKIDIEHCEWNSLKDLPDHILKQFKYIIIEFHFINPDNEGKLYYDVIKKLSKYHQVFYHRCYGRGNIAIFGNNRICKILEVSYIIKEGYNFSKDNSIYPIFEFDFEEPNLNEGAEYNLNILNLF